MNAVKTILYMGFMHGLFTLYLPYQLSLQTQIFDLGIFRYLAFLLWFFGALIIVQCSMDIIRRGRGTPAHLDPPKELVIAGWYRHVRNPIYLGALFVQFGFIFWFGSIASILYTVFFFLAFHFLILVVEEPILRKSFGESYEEYCQRVPRWVPKLR